MQKNACSVGRSLQKQRLTVIIFCLLAAFSLPIPLQAGVPQQQSTYPVKGLVTDAEGVPPAGRDRPLRAYGRGDRQRGAVLRSRLPEERGRLTFSCVGYKTVTVGYRAGETLRVRLEEGRESLEEVTVVAYGEQRRGQVSGSVATVDAARLQNKPASNVLTLAKGQMAGVYIASQSGDPGGNDVSIIVRGANDLAIAGNRNPLFVIDGVIASDDASLKVGGNPLTSLNPGRHRDVHRIERCRSGSHLRLAGCQRGGDHHDEKGPLQTSTPCSRPMSATPLSCSPGCRSGSAGMPSGAPVWRR